MTKTYDGGPAFPLAVPSGKLKHSDGVSKREWVAALALQAMIASGNVPDNKRLAAKESYEYADAMIWAQTH